MTDTAGYGKIGEPILGGRHADLFDHDRGGGGPTPVSVPLPPIQKADAVTHNMRIGLNPYRARPLFFMYSFSGAVIVSLCMNLKKRSGTL